MSEPTPGKPHPYAEIIDLFRDASPQPAAPTGAPVIAPTPEVAPPAAHAAPARAAAQPGRGRRAVMLLPVALLAVAGGTAAAVLHHHDTASTDIAKPSAAPTAAVSGSPRAQASVRPIPPAAAQEYSRALDRLTAAQDPTGLAAAARRMTALTPAVHDAKSPLARAEAGHLDALAALGTLDSGTASGLTSYTRLVTAAQHASEAVTTAAHGRDDVPDPSVATGNVVTLAGGAVVDGLGSQVGRLADATATAHLTAQLRIVAAEATALVPAATSAAEAVTDPTTSSQAAAYAQALRALAALRAIDGDHLSSWASLQTPLQQGLTAAGVTDAGDDVHAIDAMISAAQKKMDAWAAKSDGSVPLGSAAPDTAQTQRAVRAAQAAAKAAESFASRADALVDRYSQVIATLPQVAPGQQPSYELASRYNQTSRLFDGLSASVAALHAPAGMGGARSDLADLVARGRAAATAGEEMALSAAECDPAKRVCVLGAMRDWPSYRRAVDALASPSAVRATIAAGIRTAQAAVTAAAHGAGQDTTATAAPPKPVV